MAYPDSVFPADPDFPVITDAVALDSDFFSVVTGYITDITTDLARLSDNGGNIDIAIDKAIKWNATTWIDVSGGDLRVSGDLNVTGTLTKGAGAFKIDHPILDGQKLYHGFVEAPEYGLLYRGMAEVEGMATVDIDSACHMTAGTFEAIAKNPTIYLQNMFSFDAVLSSMVMDGKFTICSENTKQTIMVTWLIIAERKDKFVMESEDTDDNGHLILERR